MNITLPIWVGLALLTPAIQAATPDTPPLSGEQQDACSAILCLSSTLGGRLAECVPPLRRYFSIQLKYWADTVSARRGFLEQCPTDMAGRGAYLSALAAGAGRCDAATLNRELLLSQTVQVCSGSGRYQTCQPVEQFQIGNRLPAYCQAYVNHPYTDLSLRYVGTPKWQTAKDFRLHPAGQWVD